MINNVRIENFKNGKALELGRTGRLAKMAQFRLFQAEGSAVCELFDDCGEFEFVWNKATKVWEFFAESGEKVGSLVFNRDLEAEKAKADRYYRESMNAYEAAQRLK